jgi:hypothetical protein
MMRHLRFPLLALVLFLSGCYLPTDFEADLRISKFGNYIFTYKGKLTHLGLLRQLARKEVGEREALEKIEVIRRDLARDKGFGPGETIPQRAESIKHLENATFEVKYARKGNIGLEGSYTFVRFNARMLAIQRTDDTARGGDFKLVKVFGDRPNKELIEKLEAANLKANGRFRIQTDAVVSKHNADSQYKTPQGYDVYVWNINSLKQKPPFLEFSSDKLPEKVR